MTQVRQILTYEPLIDRPRASALGDRFMLILSFVLLFAINLGQGWLRRRTGALQEAA